MIPITQLRITKKKQSVSSSKRMKFQKMKFSTNIYRTRTLHQHSQVPTKFHQLLINFKTRLRFLSGDYNCTVSINSCFQLSPNELLVNRCMILHSPTEIHNIRYLRKLKCVKYHDDTAIQLTPALYWVFIWVLS
ncbi:hypothetical protein RNJ44_04453 [Nakaseomyces bracarensis]|uniref:Uncharacterized protein n=1 Tax=Nakaseomyces bracarensis TaxID=273131 RepID=A0ABR4NUY5_9SACH